MKNVTIMDSWGGKRMREPIYDFEVLEPLYSHARASELARTINVYWFNRGYEVCARPFVIGKDDKEGKYWGVTSDLVNGMPAQRKGAA